MGSMMSPWQLLLTYMDEQALGEGGKEKLPFNGVGEQQPFGIPSLMRLRTNGQREKFVYTLSAS